MVEVDFTLGRDNFSVRIKEKFDAGITGVFGPSGSGKTSLLQTISGLVLPDEGLIKINSKVVFDSKKQLNVPVRDRRIGYVFQEGRFFALNFMADKLTYPCQNKNNQTDQPQRAYV